MSTDDYRRAFHGLYQLLELTRDAAETDDGTDEACSSILYEGVIGTTESNSCEESETLLYCSHGKTLARALDRMSEVNKLSEVASCLGQLFSTLLEFQFSTDHYDGVEHRVVRVLAHMG